MKISFYARMVGLVSALMLAAGALALWIVSSDTRASASAPAPAAPPVPAYEAAAGSEPLAAPPAPSPKSREEKRFSRADRDDDGRISQGEYLAARRRNYDKLDANGDGRLSFEEYAASGIAKFAAADSDGNGTLQASEYASTAPKPRKPVQLAAKCDCARVQVANAEDEQGIAN